MVKIWVLLAIGYPLGFWDLPVFYFAQNCRGGVQWVCSNSVVVYNGTTS